jgi:hypothetical protein
MFPLDDQLRLILALFARRFACPYCHLLVPQTSAEPACVTDQLQRLVGSSFKPWIISAAIFDIASVRDCASEIAFCVEVVLHKVAIRQVALDESRIRKACASKGAI